MEAKLRQLAAQVEGVIFDIDGVLTDGRIIYSDNGTELKQFHVQDGASIKLLLEHGIEVAWITGRASPAVSRRAEELGVRFLRQGASNKVEALDELAAEGFGPQHLCAIGDDLADLDLFADARVCLSATVPNAHPAVAARAQWVSQRAGGDGVAVELAQLLLVAREAWPF